MGEHSGIPAFLGTDHEEPTGDNAHEVWNAWFNSLTPAQRVKYENRPIDPKILMLQRTDDMKDATHLKKYLGRQSYKVEWSDWELANLPGISDAIFEGHASDKQRSQFEAALHKIEHRDDGD